MLLSYIPSPSSLTFDSMEDFRHKGLNGFEPFHHKAQCGELAAAIADELLGQHFRKNLLEPQSLEPSEGSSWKVAWRGKEWESDE